RRLEVREAAAHGEPRAAQVGDLDVIELQGAALQSDVDVDAANRLLVVDQLGDLGLQAERRTGRRRLRGRPGRGRAGGRLALARGPREEGVEVEGVELELGGDGDRHGEGDGEAAGALEIVELEGGAGDMHVAAGRRHAALEAEPRQPVGLYRGDV